MSPNWTQDIKNTARNLGFHWVGVAPAVAPQGFNHLLEWIGAGYAGEMHFIERRRLAYSHPQHVLEGVKSLIVLGVNYVTKTPSTPPPGHGRISRYAWGDTDYHDWIHVRLRALIAELQRRAPGCRARGVVDTAPLLEREFAQLAGLGWIGKHTLLLNRDGGSYFFLGAVLTDVELQYDAAHVDDYCGTCTACLDACPTQAFPRPYVLDASRCISYLTIEHRGSIPAELRPDLGDWLFGCDVCQEVCPWNRFAQVNPESTFQPRPDQDPLRLGPLFHLTAAEFRARFRQTPLWRAKRRGLLRNAAIVLGNRPAEENIPDLIRGLADEEPLVRGASAWALGRHLTWPSARDALRQRRDLESDSQVLAEIMDALSD